MIREIINFTDMLSPEFFTINLQPSEGLHIIVELSKDGEFIDQEVGYYTKNDEVNSFFLRSIEYETHSDYIDTNKCLDLPAKKIHSCSPFVLSFKIQSYNEVKDRIKEYFGKAREVCLQNDEEKIETQSKKFETICIKEIYPELEYIKKCVDLKELKKKKKVTDTDFGKRKDDFIKKNKIKLYQGIEEKIFNNVKDSHYIKIYLKNVSIENYKKVHYSYLKSRLFNTNDYNECFDKELLGVSNYLNGFNLKKIFLQHKTAPIYEGIGGRITEHDAYSLYKFENLKTKNKILPNPLPIFIDQKELNNSMIGIFNKNERKIGYAEIIKKLYEEYKRDLGNYYLLYYIGKELKDIDFVSLFQFNIDDMKIYPIFPLGEKHTEHIRNVFDFERIVIQKIFNNGLIQKQKDQEGYKLKYFEDLKEKYFKSSSTYKLVIKYRNAVYDYIYKSNRSAITGTMFHDIMKTGILDDIKRDEYKNGRHSQEYSIKEKLNIWFSINHHFDKANKKFGGFNMPSIIPEMEERIKKIINDETDYQEHIENDHEFAYSAGQLIFYLLSRTESSNRSHAMLESFLQKKDLSLFKKEIIRNINKYKHEIKWYGLGKGRFEKLAGEVLGYETTIDLEQLMPFILTGYFSKCLVFEKTDKTKDKGEDKNE